MRRIGDLLLTTPLLHALRREFPDAELHVLVFAGTEGVLRGNADVDDIIALPRNASLAGTFAVTRRIFRRYDLAISTQSGDRPTFFALAASGRRVGLVPQRGAGSRWKSWAFQHPVAIRPHEHRVSELLRLAAEFGIATQPQQAPVVCPGGATAPKRNRYAVIHAAPMFLYRRWTQAGWRSLARALSERGLALVATGGPDPAERAYLDDLWSGDAPAIERMDGKLDWPELSALLSGAAVYVGPDTSVTHLAAASGCPTVSLFGPTDPRLWGPWPANGLDEIWEATGTQRRRNVWLVQNALPCTPCQEEGCERHRDSYSVCLADLTVEQVLAAVDEALAA